MIQWGYKKSFINCACLFLAGIIFQLIFGDLNNSFLHFPWGMIIAAIYIYSLFLINYLADKHPRLHRLYDHYACIASLASITIITIIFGLTRQDDQSTGLLSILGFTRMTSSWEFNLLLIYFTSTIGLTAIEDIYHIRKRRIIPVLSHLFIFIILVAGIFGSGDKIRVHITLEQDDPINMGIYKGEPYELPFTLTLNKFSMEEYSARIYMVDTVSGVSSVEYVTFDKKGETKQLGEWSIEVEEYYDMAIPDSIGFRKLEHIGAAPALLVRATNLLNNKQVSGWITCGSFIFRSEFIMLDKQYALFMPQRMAKHYESDVTLLSSKGREHRYKIEVNHPAKFGSWMIYQVGYDTERGRWSTSSTLECVHDNWYGVVRIALWVLLLMGVLMLITAGGRKEKKS